MQTRLAKITQYLEDNKKREFEWGVFDCCLFACDIVVLSGGADFAKDVRGKYKTEIGSKKVLKKNFGSIEQAFSSLEEVPFNFAQRGDLTLFDTDNGQVMSVKWHDGHYAVSPKDGIGKMKDTTKPVKTWRAY